MVDEFGPRLAHVPAEQTVKVRVELQVVLVEVIEELVGAEHLCDLDQLVVVVVPVKKGLLAEDHAGKHAAERPHVERVVVVLQVDEQLGALEVARGDADVELALRVVKLGEAPVDQAQLALLVVDHDVVRLHVAVHDAVGMAVLERLEQLVDVVAHVVVCERGVERAEVGVVDVLEDERGRLGLRVPDDIEQLDDVGPARQIHQDLDLALDLLLLDGFEDLDDHLGAVGHAHALEHLRVLTAPDLADDLVVVLLAPLHLQALIVPVLLGPLQVDVRVPARARHAL
mmetsp:Transcript_51395/g.111835  ORF Transcript_51395/g.111835 Transcript_51395/m.111835 type:complete len:285 (-) Transcript_51395:240-1094(-)